MSVPPPPGQGPGQANQQASTLNLPTAFHFAVTFASMQVRHAEAAFQEASGLSSEMETEAVAEGGRNDYVHFLPKPVKHPRLVLKRGMADLASIWVKWCKATLEGGLSQRIEPLDLRVALMAREGQIVRQWLLTRAYPVKWDVDAFNSQRNELAMERIELVYASSKRDK
ncbi:phage tail protein [Roseateles sp. SL47]|jgi:phage tail-like protein|uniref:phage tail protein n=1 Tax=Roseateles sp. SL47 TaxID=2995138 RepID=UPI00226F3800|nr:phage tail protein [Roseateles sp. SL47]WAC71480.1 phage tail protein [Roseateles sp. SL47]